MPLGVEVLPHKKWDLKLCFIRLMVIMESLYLRVQKCKFTPKVTPGRG